MRDTIDMAREAWISEAEAEMLRDSEECYLSCTYLVDLKAFEALVRADEREQYKWDIHSCGPTCKRYACVAMREAVEAEREACAALADKLEWADNKGVASAIRARGNT
jgi:hypothetical protein